MMHYSMTMTGSLHRLTGTRCQDHTAYVRSGSIGASALSDGAGSLQRSGEGAMTISHAAACFLASSFSRLIAMDDDAIRRELYDLITRILANLSARYGENAVRFGSTLLAVGCDARTGEYLVVHIGDGLICTIPAGSCTPVPLSLPERGRRANETYLTVSLLNPGGLFHIRIKRGRGAGIFMLTSDGAEDSLFCENGLVLSPSLTEFTDMFLSAPEQFDSIFRSAVQRDIRPVDDFSFSMLFNVPAGLSSVGYDASRPNVSALRSARRRMKYANARDANLTQIQAARQAGWRQNDFIKRKLPWLIRLGIESS